MTDECLLVMSVGTHEFLKSSRLEILVPRATDLDTNELAGHAGDVKYSPEKRSLLYFGMQRRSPPKAPLSYSFLGTC